jgi:threonine/homoserine/homoserine lactone efflux protein
MHDMLIDFAAFVGISALVIMSPGQDTALVIRNTLAGGRHGGILTALGVVAGQAVWVVASAVGLTALLVASGPAFTAVRLAGAAYLLYLGGRCLYRALRDKVEIEAARQSREAAPSARAAFRQGLLSALSNPKLAAFFAGLFPQFLPRAQASSAVLFGLGFTFCTMTLVWLVGYAIAVAKARRFLLRSSIRRTLEAALGATLVALGIRVAVARH